MSTTSAYPPQGNVDQSFTVAVQVFQTLNPSTESRKCAGENRSDVFPEIALDWGLHKVIVDLLLANEAKIEMLLHKQAEKSYLRRESVELLLARGTDINAKDNTGRTPLHVAAEHYFDGTYYRRDHKTAELLVERGANVDTKDNDGRTPLHIAAAMGQKSAVLILLQGKEKLNAKGFIDFSAARENGATINVVDIDGKTPLQCAMARGHKEIVELLRHHGGRE